MPTKVIPDMNRKMVVEGEASNIWLLVRKCLGQCRVGVLGKKYCFSSNVILKQSKFKRDQGPKERRSHNDDDDELIY